MSQANQEIKGYEEKAAKSWDIDRIFDDLSNSKDTLSKENDLSNSKGKQKKLTEGEKQYLCLLLNRISVTRIAELKSITINSVRTALSDGIYSYINYLFQTQIEDWRDVSDILENKGYKIKSQVAKGLILKDLPEPIGWIWLGAVNSTSGNLPPEGTPLMPTIQQPVTILPMDMPEIGLVVALMQYVNLRNDRPRQENNFMLGEKIKQLPIGTRLVILKVDAYIDPQSDCRNTRIWAKVGAYSPPIVD